MQLIKTSYCEAEKLVNVALRNNRARPRCVLCGDSSPSTKEHIPPQGVFPCKKGLSLVTVPACLKCNDGTSHLDTAFVDLMSIYNNRYGAPVTDESIQLFNRFAAKSERGSNKRLSTPLKAALKTALKLHVPVITPGGLSLPARGIPQHKIWPTQFHDPVLHKIISGLYWVYHEGQLMADIDFEVTIVRYIDFGTESGQRLLGQNFPGIKIGNGQFIARHQQHFGNDQSVAGVFALTLHFHCNERTDTGYHAMVMCTPKHTLESFDTAETFVRYARDGQFKRGSVNHYNVINGRWAASRLVS